MAREIIVSVWCDRHLEREENVRATSHQAKLDNIEGELDLCEECWDELSAELRALITRAAQPTRAEPADKTSTEKDRPIVCPICPPGTGRTGGRYTKRAGLHTHMVNKHGQALAEFETEAGYNIDGQKLTCWCGTCGAGYADARGARGHLKSVGHEAGGIVYEPPARPRSVA